MYRPFQHDAVFRDGWFVTTHRQELAFFFFFLDKIGMVFMIWYTGSCALLIEQ